MLRGRYTATVDPKGRVKIPAEFKTILDKEYGPEVYVTSLTGENVRIYPLAEWRQIEDRLAALPSMNKAKNKLLERTNFWGQAGKMDAQGRILIPWHLRESATITGEVAVMGYPDRLDVWNLQRFTEHLDGNPITEEDEKTLSDLGI